MARREYHGKRSLEGYSSCGHRVQHNWATEHAHPFLGKSLQGLGREESKVPVPARHGWWGEDRPGSRALRAYPLFTGWVVSVPLPREACHLIQHSTQNSGQWVVGAKEVFDFKAWLWNLSLGAEGSPAHWLAIWPWVCSFLSLSLLSKKWKCQLLSNVWLFATP